MKNINLHLYASLASLVYFSILFLGILNRTNQVFASVVVELVTIPMIIIQLIATFFAIRILFSASSEHRYKAIAVVAISVFIFAAMFLVP